MVTQYLVGHSHGKSSHVDWTKQHNRIIDFYWSRYWSRLKIMNKEIWNCLIKCMNLENEWLSVCCGFGYSVGERDSWFVLLSFFLKRNMYKDWKFLQINMWRFLIKKAPGYNVILTSSSITNGIINRYLVCLICFESNNLSFAFLIFFFFLYKQCIDKNVQKGRKKKDAKRLYKLKICILCLKILIFAKILLVAPHIK